MPCPGRIFEDLGGGYMIGCFGGTLVYFITGKILITIKELGILQEELRLWEDSTMLGIELPSLEVHSLCGEDAFPQLIVCSFISVKRTILSTQLSVVL